MKEKLEQYKNELENEARNILHYWMQHAIDNENGGFNGRLDNNNTVYTNAPKGSVLNSRILWTFSAAYNYSREQNYLDVAHRACNYIVDHFIDKEFGGVYWTVDSNGYPLGTKKQIYALAFTLYGLSEYVIASGSEKAKELAVQLYQTIEHRSHDTEKGGYIEALTRDWKDINDLRLSDKDANEKKSMNTHLHVLEAFANLYRIWPDDGLRKNIQELIRVFLQHIIDPETNHLILFFDDGWQVRSNVVSYGHDIEAAWLISDAAEVIGDEVLVQQVKARSIKIAQAAREGLDKDGGLWYEYERDKKQLIKEKHWWPQAEAMVGFFNAWQLSGDETYFSDSINCWGFVKDNILDKENGEWLWGVNEAYSQMRGQDKVGVWKCPYHNTRACIEIIKRISSMNVCSLKVEASFS